MAPGASAAGDAPATGLRPHVGPSRGVPDRRAGSSGGRSPNCAAAAGRRSRL